MDLFAIVLAHEEPFELGPVRVRPQTREIEYAGRTVVIEPRVMQVLVALFRAGGQVVSKDDLIARCWENRIVGDDAINRVVSRLRRNALEDAGGSFKIETITKVGYRLSLPDGPLSSSYVAVSRRSIVTLGAGLAVAGLAAGAGYWIATSSKRAERHELDEIRRTLLVSTPDQIDNATTQARQFVEKHPNSADGWGLYSVASYFRIFGFMPMMQKEQSRRTEAIAKRALAIEHDQPDALATLASLRGFGGRWTEAYRDIFPVVRSSPDNFFANNFLANLFSQTGNYTLALQYAERALEIEIEAPLMWMLKALAYDNLGKFPEAQNTIEQAFERWPAQYAIFFTRLYLLGYGGRTSEALAMIRDQADWPVGVNNDNQTLTRAQMLALGDRRPAMVDEALELSLRMARRGTGFAENAMQFTAALNMPAIFFDLAERYFFDPSYIEGSSRFSEEQRVYSNRRTTWFLFRRPVLNMWPDPRFDLLVQRIGLAKFWDQSGFQPEFRSMR